MSPCPAWTEDVMFNVVSGYPPQVCKLEVKFWSEVDEVMQSIPRDEEW